MNGSGLIFGILYLAISVFLYLLMARIVVDFIQVFARGWRPRGAALLFASTVHRCTEPLLGWVRKLLPPVGFGGVRLDLSFIIVFFVLSLVRTFVLRIGMQASYPMMG